MKNVICIFLLIAVIVSCNNNRNENAEKAISDAICIYPESKVRIQFGDKSETIASLKLSEKVKYLIKKPVEKVSDIEYLFIELSDGKQGWVQRDHVMIDVIPAAITERTPIYLRPDLSAITDQYFNIAEFIVISDETDEWAEVTGTKKHKKGWIRKNGISLQPDDVAIASLAYKQIIDEEGDLNDENLSVFIENIPYKEAKLTSILQAYFKEQVEKAIEQSIIEYVESSGTGNGAD